MKILIALNKGQYSDALLPQMKHTSKKNEITEKYIFTEVHFLLTQKLSLRLHFSTT